MAGQEGKEEVRKREMREGSGGERKREGRVDEENER